MRGKFDFLKERAEQFLKEAEYDMQCQNLELCAFHLEQSCQLFLKYTLGIILGDFPHIHNLLHLMKAVAKTTGTNDL